MTHPLSSAAQLREYHDRVRELRHELTPGSPPFDAAVLLLALRDTPPNVDRLAVRLRLARGFVARCMRHLFDNGVLAEAGVVALWAGEEFDSRAFWADVNVALGKWWRRSDGPGRVEWVPAGTWRKQYDFVTTPQTESARHAVYYPREEVEEEPEEGLSLRVARKRPLWIGAVVGEGMPWKGTGEEKRGGDELIGLPSESPADANSTFWLC